jgi:hypothetical protein
MIFLARDRNARVVFRVPGEAIGRLMGDGEQQGIITASSRKG